MSTRTVGQFPISIASSLALEGLFGVHPNQPPRPAGFKAISALWVNIRTLIRNYYESHSSDEAKRLKLDIAAIEIASEMQVIMEVMSKRPNSPKVVFYHQPIERIKEVFPNAKYKVANTENQARYKAFEDNSIRFLLAEAKMSNIPIQIVGRTIDTQRDTAAMITHYAIDLLWKPKFDRLFLLESHTGKLKLYVDWYTKLKGKIDNSLPFNEFTVQIFGDGHLLDTYDKKIRNEVKQIAELKRWNGTTSFNKVTTDVLGVGGHTLRDAYRRLIP